MQRDNVKQDMNSKWLLMRNLIFSHLIFVHSSAKCERNVKNVPVRSMKAYAETYLYIAPLIHNHGFRWR